MKKIILLQIIWKTLYKTTDGIYKAGIGFLEDKLVFKTSKNAPNYKIASVKIDDFNFETQTTVVPERQDEIINDFVTTTNGVIFTTVKNGVETKLRHLKNNQEERIKLPFVSGKIAINYIGNQTENFMISLKGWSSSYKDFRYNITENKFSELNLVTNATYSEFQYILVKEVVVISHDGEQVPLSIIYNRSLVTKNKENPTLFHGYGAYGKSITSFLSSAFLT